MRASCITLTALATYNTILNGNANVLSSYQDYSNSYNAIINGINNCNLTGLSNTHFTLLGRNTCICRDKDHAVGVGNLIIVARSERTYFEYIAKTTNNFKIHHPDPQKTSTHFLFHSAVETPSAGDNIYRYEVTTINGSATLQLPDYHRFLNRDEQVWVTPKGHMGVAYGTVSQDQRTVEFTSDADGEYQVLIVATRKDAAAARFWNGAERLRPM